MNRISWDVCDESNATRPARYSYRLAKRLFGTTEPMIVIFDRRIKLYHAFCKIVFQISILKNEISMYPFSKSMKSGESLDLTIQDLKEIRNSCMSINIALAATIEEMVFVFSNQHLINVLNNELKSHSDNICKYSSEIFNKEKTYNISEDTYSRSQKYLDSLWGEQEEVHTLFKNQLQLKNIEYFYTKYKSAICILLKC